MAPRPTLPCDRILHGKPSDLLYIYVLVRIIWVRYPHRVFDHAYLHKAGFLRCVLLLVLLSSETVYVRVLVVLVVWGYVVVHGVVVDT